MPRTQQQIIDHADELAERLAADDVRAIGPTRDATELRSLAEAVIAAGRAEATLTDAVAMARTAGHSWSAIGVMLGTSAQAAQRRYRDQVRGFAALHRATPDDLIEHRSVFSTRREAEALLDELARQAPDGFDLQEVTERSTGRKWVRTTTAGRWRRADAGRGRPNPADGAVTPRTGSR